MPTVKTSKKTRRDRRKCVHFHDCRAGECIIHELGMVFGCSGVKGCPNYAEPVMQAENREGGQP